MSDEQANTLTHGLGLVLSLAAVPFLIALAVIHGNTWHVVSCSVYGATLVALYAASTSYHFALSRGTRWGHVLRIVDHACIYLLIAGSYTPFALVMLRGDWGWTIFGIVWGLAALGITFKVFWTGQFELISTATYLLMGWGALIAFQPVMEIFPGACLAWVLAGGISYTLGTVFYLFDRKPFMHAAWHLAVLAGSACHYVAVIGYVLPAKIWA